MTTIIDILCYVEPGLKKLYSVVGSPVGVPLSFPFSGDGTVPMDKRAVVALPIYPKLKSGMYEDVPEVTEPTSLPSSALCLFR